MENTYASKVDAWLLIVVGAVIVVCLVIPYFSYRSSGFAALPSSLISLVIGAGLPLWVFVSTRYRLDDAALFVTTGPFKWEIPVRDITAVTPTRNPLSSPALSLDRLRIDYGRGKSLMISPKDKQKFLDDLEARRKKILL